MATHTHPCSRLHLPDGLEMTEKELQPHTARRALHSSQTHVPSLQQSSNVQAQRSSCSSLFQRKLRNKSSCESGRQPSLFALERRWSHTAKRQNAQRIPKEIYPPYYLLWALIKSSTSWAARCHCHNPEVHFFCAFSTQIKEATI